MAGLCWVAVMLAFFLSAKTSLAAVDQNRLSRIVDGILREYRVNHMFSLAVSIPENQNQDIDQILQQVFRSDPGDSVKNKINNDEVYIGRRVVAAKFLKRSRGSDHAESRVVNHLDQLNNSPNANDNDMLLFYVYASPCVEKCSSKTHDERILERIKRIRRWKSYAVVFSKIFIPNNHEANTDQELRGALQRLGASVGLDNIFRCDIRNGRMQCTSCSIGTQVANYCVSDDTKSSTSFIQLQQDNRNGNLGHGGSGRGGGMGRGGGWGRGGGMSRRGGWGGGGGMSRRGSWGGGGGMSRRGSWGGGGGRGRSGGWGRGGGRGRRGGRGRSGGRGRRGGRGRG